MNLKFEKAPKQVISLAFVVWIFGPSSYNDPIKITQL